MHSSCEQTQSSFSLPIIWPSYAHALQCYQLCSEHSTNLLATARGTAVFGRRAVSARRRRRWLHDFGCCRGVWERSIPPASAMSCTGSNWVKQAQTGSNRVKVSESTNRHVGQRAVQSSTESKKGEKAFSRSGTECSSSLLHHANVPFCLLQ